MEYGTDEWLEKMGFKEKEAPKTNNIDLVPGTTQAAKDILTPDGSKGGEE